MPMQFYIVACNEAAGCGDWSDIIEIISIDYCNEDTEDCSWEDMFEDEVFYEYALGYIGDEVSETTYHLAWEAPEDPYGFYGEPLGYLVFADGFENNM